MKVISMTEAKKIAQQDPRYPEMKVAVIGNSDFIKYPDGDIDIVDYPLFGYIAQKEDGTYECVAQFRNAFDGRGYRFIDGKIIKI